MTTAKTKTKTAKKRSTKKPSFAKKGPSPAKKVAAKKTAVKKRPGRPKANGSMAPVNFRTDTGDIAAAKKIAEHGGIRFSLLLRRALSAYVNAYCRKHKLDRDKLSKH